MARILTLILTTCLTLLLSGQQSPSIGDLQVFPEDNPWNWNISGYEVHPNSGNYIKSIGEDGHLHPDFGTEWMGVPNGIPYVVVHSGEPEIPIYYTDFGPESDPGPFPISLGAPIEGGSESQGDRHVIAVDLDNKMLYELYYAFPKDSFWNAASGAKFDLTSNALRPAGWTSADAAGLPIFPGLVRYEEVYINNEIDHALRFTVANTQKAYIWPARHYASSNTNTNAPPMGLRLRLKDSVDISAFSDPVKVILTALKKYGMMLADNGSDWFISGAPDERWNDDLLGEIKAIPGKHFEVVRTVDDNGDPIFPSTQSAAEKITKGNFSSTAYPNPFRDKTTITFILQQNGFVELSILDMQGRKVETLIKNKLAKGEHHITYKRQNYASGLYYYILITRNKRDSGKLVVVD